LEGWRVHIGPAQRDLADLAALENRPAQRDLADLAALENRPASTSGETDIVDDELENPPASTSGAREAEASNSSRIDHLLWGSPISDDSSFPDDFNSTCSSSSSDSEHD